MTIDVKKGNAPTAEQEAAGGRSNTYERPTLIPVGNLHDLLAQGGTQNADPGTPSTPSCHPGTGTFFDGGDCS